MIRQKVDALRQYASQIKSVAELYYRQTRGVRFLFVVGHMRSGSSLLMHVLNSHPSILGYGETHRRYHGVADLVHLEREVLEKLHVSRGGTPSYRYVADKILHNYVLDEDVLGVRSLKMLVSVRSPERSLPSILDLGLAEIETEAQALAYYVGSLDRIERWIKQYGRAVLVVDYDNLVGDGRTLTDITRYLQVEDRLSHEYDTTPCTGRSGVGDPGGNIQKGRIVRPQTIYQSTVRPDTLSKAWARYRSFREGHDARF